MKLLKSVVVAVSLIFCVNVFAEGKIGVVDPQRIAAQSKEMKKIGDKIDKEFKSRREALVKLQNQLQQDSEKLKRDDAILAKSEKTDLQNKIMQAQRQLERKGRDYQQDLNMAQGQAMQKFKENMQIAIAKVAKKQGYDLVLVKEAAPYSVASVDITQLVIEAIN